MITMTAVDTPDMADELLIVLSRPLSLVPEDCHVGSYLFDNGLFDALEQAEAIDPEGDGRCLALAYIQAMVERDKWPYEPDAPLLTPRRIVQGARQVIPDIMARLDIILACHEHTPVPPAFAELHQAYYEGLCQALDAGHDD